MRSGEAIVHQHKPLLPQLLVSARHKLEVAPALVLLAAPVRPHHDLVKGALPVAPLDVVEDETERMYVKVSVVLVIV
jgi:hypothetical protein